MKKTPYTSYDQLPLMLTVPDVSQVLGISLAGTYELARSDGHSVKSCVSENRQSQGWRWGNSANRGLKPFLATRPGGRGGMRAAGGVNAALTAETL